MKKIAPIKLYSNFLVDINLITMKLRSAEYITLKRILHAQKIKQKFYKLFLLLFAVKQEYKIFWFVKLKAYKQYIVLTIHINVSLKMSAEYFMCSIVNYQ